MLFLPFRLAPPTEFTNTRFSRSWGMLKDGLRGTNVNEELLLYVEYSTLIVSSS